MRLSSILLFCSLPDLCAILLWTTKYEFNVLLYTNQILICRIFKLQQLDHFEKQKQRSSRICLARDLGLALNEGSVSAILSLDLLRGKDLEPFPPYRYEDIINLCRVGEESTYIGLYLGTCAISSG